MTTLCKHGRDVTGDPDRCEHCRPAKPTPAPSEVPEGYSIARDGDAEWAVSVGLRYYTSEKKAIAACHAHAHRQREIGREEGRREVGEAVQVAAAAAHRRGLEQGGRLARDKFEATVKKWRQRELDDCGNETVTSELLRDLLETFVVEGPDHDQDTE